MRRVLRSCGYAAVLAVVAAGGACGASEHGLTVIVHGGGAAGAAGGGGVGIAGISTSGAGGGTTTPYTCSSDPPDAPVLRRSIADLDGSLSALFGDGPTLASRLPPERGYYRDLSGSFVVALQQVMTERAHDQVADENSYTACEPGDEERPGCIQAWLRDWGARIYKQPLSDEQVSAYAAQFRGARRELTPAEAARNSLVSLLLSPYFVLRLELGSSAPDQQLSLYELAARISHFAARRLPDATLTASAESGALADPKEALAQYRRLAATAEGRAARELFHLEWLGIAAPLDRPDLEPELVADMQTQARLLVTEVFDNQNGTLSSLLTTSSQPLNDRLAKNYGVPIAPGDAFHVTNLDAWPFAGLLSTGAFLARYRGPSRRGQQIADALLCSKVPDPPAAGHPNASPLAPGQTPRERLAASVSNNPPCMGCHSRVDPPGLALEAFDDQARLTSADTSGGFVDTQSGGTIPVAGPRELGNAIAGSLTGRTCAARRYLELALDRRLSDSSNSDANDGAGNPGQESPAPAPIIRADPDLMWLACLTNTVAAGKDVNLTALSEAIVNSSGFRSHADTPRRVIAFDSSIDPLEHAAREAAQLVGAFNDTQTIQGYLNALRDAELLVAFPGAGGSDAGGANGNDAGAPSAGGAPATGGAP